MAETLHVAIIGSGPSGYYTAEGLQKQFGDQVQIDILDRLPTPFGLIRAGVAPDHQSIKAVTKRYTETALSDNVRFVGNIDIGDGVTIVELQQLYHAVVLATGAPRDRPLGIAGEKLPGVIGSAAFVGWYNGHPDFATLEVPLAGEAAVVIGNGNVALDVARILSKTQEEFAGSDIVEHARAALSQSHIRDIYILGRRGPHQMNFTIKELSEMGHLARAQALVDIADFPPEAQDAALDTGTRKSVTCLREFAQSPASDKPVRVHFDFFAKPVAIEGEGHVRSISVERTQLVDGQVRGTGETYSIACSLIVPCIGYRTLPIPDVPYDNDLGRFINDEGVIGAGLYCVGWARRGPTGTIGTNRPDGFMIAEKIAAASPSGPKAGRAGLDRLMESRNLAPVTFRDWQKIDAAEVSRAAAAHPREKFVTIEEMLRSVR